jgi:hypothetical protein
MGHGKAQLAVPMCGSIWLSLRAATIKPDRSVKERSAEIPLNCLLTKPGDYAKKPCPVAGRDFECDRDFSPIIAASMFACCATFLRIIDLALLQT